MKYLLRELHGLPIGRNAKKKDMADKLKRDVFKSDMAQESSRKLYRKHADKMREDRKNGTGYFGSGGGNTVSVSIFFHVNIFYYIFDNDVMQTI